MAEVAGEELAKLEAAHPGRFGPLKAELQRLVADPGLDAAALFPLVSPRSAAVTTDDDADAGSTPASSQPDPHSLAAAVCTQESSTRKRKPPGGAVREREREEGKRRRRAGTPPGGVKDRAEMAIERAERCLERIRAVKRGLLAAWIH
ncbi:unnamed protein product [Urochloa humidicola]